jgi:hypothetical protein
MRTTGQFGYHAVRARRQLMLGAPLLAAGLTLLISSVGLLRDAPLPAGGRSLLPLAGLLLMAAGVQALTGWWRFRVRLCGEAAALQRLAVQLGHELDSSFTLLLNVRGVALRGAVDAATAVLVGPHGVLVLLVKRLAGSFRLEGDRWWLLTESSDRPWDRSPTWEVHRRLRAVRRYLQSEGSGDVPVHAAVVANGAVQVEIDERYKGPPPSAIVLAPPEVAAYVRCLAAEHPIEPLRVSQLIDSLGAAPAIGPVNESISQ